MLQEIKQSEVKQSIDQAKEALNEVEKTEAKAQAEEDDDMMKRSADKKFLLRMGDFRFEKRVEV